MSNNQYPNDVQFAGLIQAATAAADAQERNASILGKRRRSQDESLIDTQLRAHANDSTTTAHIGLPSSATPMLQSSAAVLFREPSEKSKKYSRPPLGKVYTDLQLAPESFLRLQNAAKEFMLDENHIGRRDVVGHKKHSSNNDVAKLRLWGCVEEFLNQDGNGDRWFGHNAGFDIPDAPERTFFWPEDKQRIMKLCMPLFRKMVTNERQRLYASESRKQDPSKVDKNKQVSTSTRQSATTSPVPELPARQDAAIDQSLNTPDTTQENYSTTEQHGSNSSGQVNLHINIVSSDANTGHRLKPKLNASSDSLSTLSALIAEVNNKCDLNLPIGVFSGDGWFTPIVKVLLPNGLVRIKDDGQWMMALLSASMVDWMDSELRVLVEIPEIMTL